MHRIARAVESRLHDSIRLETLLQESNFKILAQRSLTQSSSAVVGDKTPSALDPASPISYSTIIGVKQSNYFSYKSAAITAVDAACDIVQR